MRSNFELLNWTVDNNWYDIIKSNMEPTNEGGIVQAEPESEQLEGEIGEDEAEAEK